MKANFLVLSIISLVSLFENPPSTEAQGAFVNLDFEAAALPSVPAGQDGSYVPIADALPGWSAAIDGTPVTQVLQNNYDFGSPSIDIFGPSWNSVDPGIIGGNYTVFLQASIAPYNVSLSQTGTIPANAQSIQFSAWSWLPSSTVFTVSFDGDTLSPVVLSSGETAAGQPYTVYGANIAPYAGQTGQLEFTSGFNNSGPSWTELDDISFSPDEVPEPGTMAFLLMAGVAFGARRWRAKGS